jgi:hypothetical protein
MDRGNERPKAGYALGLIQARIPAPIPAWFRGFLATCGLIFRANRRMMAMQTNLSAMVAAGTPAGGEMSGLTAHFLFGAKAAPTQRHNPGQTLRQKDR